MAKQDVELKFSLIDGVSKGLAEIQQGVSGLGAQLVKVNAAAELTGKAFGLLGDVAGSFASAVTGAASVEDALTRVNTITRATAEEQVQLQDAVRAAVAGTRFSASEAAGALVLLAEDGFTAKEAIAQLGSVLQFAQGNAQSAAQAAQGLGAVLDTFGEKPQAIGALADSLTAVAREAGTSTKALQEGLSGSGVAAEQFGLKLNDAIGYLGLLAQRGIEGAQGGRQLTKILQELGDKASPAGQEIAKLGIKSGDFAGILQRLGSDSTAAEKVLAALGDRPRAALRALLTEGGGDLGKFRKILDESAGSAKAASDVMNTTFAGALDRIQNQLSQTRDDLLTPILAPLAEEFTALGERIQKFVASADFERIKQQITEFATQGIKDVGDFVEGFDFEGALKATADFAKFIGEHLQDMRGALGTTTNAVGGFADGMVVSFESVRAAIAGSLASTLGAFAGFSEEAGNLSLSLAGIAEEARDNAGSAMAKLVARFEESSKAAKEAAGRIKDTGKAAHDAAIDYQGLALAMLPEPMRVYARALIDVAEAQRKTEQTATDAAKAQRELQTTANVANIATYEGQLASLVRTQTLLIESGQANGVAMRGLSDAIAETEGKIAALRAANTDAAGSADDLTNSTNNAANALRNQASAADSAGNAGGRLESSNSQVSKSFGNIGRQSSEVAIGLGTMTQAYLEQITAVAGAAKSAGDYIRAISAGFAAFEDEEKRIRDRIAILDRQNASLSEEDKIRAQIERRYGTSSTLVDVLIQKELALHEARKKTNEETQRGLDIEKERAGVAGGFGAGRPNADQGAATAAGKGAGDQGGGKGAVVNITVQGLPNDRDTWRGIVRDLIEPELRNLRALGK